MTDSSIHMEYLQSYISLMLFVGPDSHPNMYVCIYVCILIISPEMICKIFYGICIFFIGEKVSMVCIWCSVPNLSLSSFFILLEPSTPESFAQKMTLPLYIGMQWAPYFISGGKRTFPSLQHIVEIVSWIFPISLELVTRVQRWRQRMCV